MDYGIFNMCTDVVCKWLHMGAHGHPKRVCTESWPWEKKSLATLGNQTCVGGVPVWCSTNWATSLPYQQLIIIIINPLTARVVGAPQMILQPVFSIFPCSLLPSGTWRTPGLSIPWWCLPTSSFVPRSLCLARWFWPDLMNGKHDHTTAVCVFLRSSGDLHVVQLPDGSWHGLPRW